METDFMEIHLTVKSRTVHAKLQNLDMGRKQPEPTEEKA
jgi:hypothetical protein